MKDGRRREGAREGGEGGGREEVERKRKRTEVGREEEREVGEEGLRKESKKEG